MSDNGLHRLMPDAANFPVLHKSAMEISSAHETCCMLVDNEHPRPNCGRTSLQELLWPVGHQSLCAAALHVDT